jgi:hypothetical protein
MDPQIVDLARTAGTAVVTLLATDAWQATRDGIVGVWRRAHPERADGVGEELDATRDELVAARQTGDGEAEVELAAEWQGRVRRLLAARPEAVDDLRRVLEELGPAERPATTEIRMTAEASGHGRVYQAGRDQHISER